MCTSLKSQQVVLQQGLLLGLILEALEGPGLGLGLDPDLSPGLDLIEVPEGSILDLDLVLTGEDHVADPTPRSTPGNAAVIVILLCPLAGVTLAIGG